MKIEGVSDISVNNICLDQIDDTGSFDSAPLTELADVFAIKCSIRASRSDDIYDEWIKNLLAAKADLSRRVG
ncbi:MAG: hypothetical protein CVV11_15960 [Gammaproteobacteria bacterium HGW-Gammaproteobacteria-15]|nr:MAG: hypothetical protein CVV11_15960 [Gammaproteobacteria bacterium HGW-Gammaproteobacteria-15]